MPGPVDTYAMTAASSLLLLTQARVEGLCTLALGCVVSEIPARGLALSLLPVHRAEYYPQSYTPHPIQGPSKLRIRPNEASIDPFFEVEACMAWGSIGPCDL